MGDFIATRSLPAVKDDGKPPDPGQTATNSVWASDWNAHRTALLDLHAQTAGWVNVRTYGADPSSSASVNGSAFAAAEASGSARVYLPDGDYALPDETFLTKEYVGPGRMLFGAEAIRTTHRSLSAPALRGATVLGDLAQFRKAIQARAATVVFMGDSITEGVFQVSYEDSWASLFAEELRRRVPGVAWNIQNLSLAGLGIVHASSSTFAGGATNDYSTIFNRPKGTDLTYLTSPSDLGILTGNPDLWPAGSTNGKTWRDHVKDAAPDLLVIALGQNDTDGDTAAWVASLKALIAYSQTWTKKPSIAIVTTIAPTRKQATWRGYTPAIQSITDAARGVALETKATLLDANRLWLLYRDGIDVASPRARAVNAFLSYPANWSSGSALPAISGGDTLTFTGAQRIYRVGQLLRDVHISATFTPTVGSTAFGLNYRLPSTVPGAIGYEAQINGGWAVLYWQSTQVAATAITPPANGSANVLDVVAIGAHHVVRLNGVKAIDAWDYSSLLAGAQGVDFDGAGTVKILSLQAGEPKVVGPPVFTEDELLGKSVADYWTNPATLGGDGIHHPTPLGHYATLYAASLGLIESAERAYQAGATVVSGGGSATAGDLAATDYVYVSVGSTDGAASMVGGAAGALSGSASTAATVTVAAGGVVTCYLKKNAGTELSSYALIFPAAGTYQVFVSGSASHNGTTIRHSVNALAIRAA